MAAFDAYLMTGGQPVTVMSWAPGASPHKFLVQTLADPTSALVASGAQILDSEFPEQAAARKVLRAIGGRGERAWSRVRDAAGLTQTSLERSLEILTDARVIAADEPVSTRRAPKEKRWRIADPALRYWLAMVEPVLPDIYRRRPDIAFSWHEERYSAWRGRAIEPVVRDALMRILPSDEWPDARHVGGWWPRSNNPEIDLVGVDTVPGNRVGLVGTIKWRRRGPVTTSEVTVAGTSALAVPGVMPSTPLVAVCPAGAVADQRLTATWTADDLLEAWPQ
ncbi:MAG: DUF234 domain-containing protein, partial [Cellulomonadaceae bacterium]|jgi:DNA-binding transcriptional ArsR family regulator|nr:DUF234 domain-containing protein [Cellulomonadaceae bacterium]